MTDSAATVKTTADTYMAALALALRYTADLNRKHGDEHHEYTVDATGRKYLRLVVSSYGSRSVHAFVEVATGALLKAAGWTGPAAGARYDLSTEEGYAEALAASDRFGGYLYRR